MQHALVPLQMLQYRCNQMQGAGHADEAWRWIVTASALEDELRGGPDQIAGGRYRVVLAPDHHRGFSIEAR